MHNLEATEVIRLSEQERIDKLKSPLERNQWGQFATPPQLALDIAKYAHKHWRSILKGKRQATFLDPAIGSGAFYYALRQVFSRDEVKLAAGIELDPLFAEAAKSLWGKSGLKVTQADFTTLSPATTFNLLLTNPPYVRHHHLERMAKERLKSQIEAELKLEISGLAGLYCHFMLLADKWLDEDALCIWLIPSEFMTVNYGVALKEYLTNNVTLLHIHRFQPEDVQFSDALVSSAIVVFRKSAPQKKNRVLFSLGGPLSKPHTLQKVPLAEIDITSKWTMYPRSDGKNSVTRSDDLSLGDLFSIKRGIATGDNKFFVLDRQVAKSHGIPPSFLRPILPSPRYLHESVIETADDGYPLLKNTSVLIDCSLPEDILKKQHPRFWDYLQTGKKAGVDQGYLVSRRTPWYSQERRGPAPFLCTYMGRATNGRAGSPFRFIWNKSQATAANVYLLLYPKPLLQERLNADPDLYESIFRILCKITGDMFLKESRVYGGGLHKVEPKELARVSAHEIAAAIDGIRQTSQSLLFA